MSDERCGDSITGHITGRENADGLSGTNLQRMCENTRKETHERLTFDSSLIMMLQAGQLSGSRAVILYKYTGLLRQRAAYRKCCHHPQSRRRPQLDSGSGSTEDRSSSERGP